MKSFLYYLAKGFQLSGMASLPFAIFFGETEKSMSYELNYLLLGIFLFIIGYFLESKFANA